ncbi:hypothetical protein A2415_01825 [candidate division WWE3 bacterium RIFOXYC1_FULL_39_7]|uniref:Glycosyltransferase RgtA/B/C/D-like domain-containing protein n=1 Tax=candidate division WWE3 bacterium RIFOXYC1_FULL_39_7 TaxID=1802643 RepID=A0A1F4WFY7_UNCKA|nr:MAG: hypothetical protein A2415_01825 [candidate division WWE3 bacterium RIFOXYC1_FULL_39_7]
MSKEIFGRIVCAFVIWRAVLFLGLLFGQKWLFLQNDFLGGGKGLYLVNPFLWSWVNFDGEHYLAIAREGYKPLTYFYFPMYPLMVRGVANWLGGSLVSFAVSGLIISNGLFLGALFGLYKLLNVDYKNLEVWRIMFLLLVFPTSFYFGAFYTESSFMFLAVWSFYFARRGKWLWVGILGALAAATRVIGIVLLPALLIEWWLQNDKKKKVNLDLFYLFLIPIGLLTYMYYLAKVAGDPLEFLNSVEIFGDQRSASLIMLPQVFYRYVFKIIPSLTSYWPVVFVVLIEFFIGFTFLMLSVLGWWKLRKSYWIFMVGGYLVPTLSGSFSSLPRYVLPLFPAFILLSHYLGKLPMVMKGMVYLTLLAFLVVACAMFVRGYWVA